MAYRDRNLWQIARWWRAAFRNRERVVIHIFIPWWSPFCVFKPFACGRALAEVRELHSEERQTRFGSRALTYYGIVLTNRDAHQTRSVLRVVKTIFHRDMMDVKLSVSCFVYGWVCVCVCDCWRVHIVHQLKELGNSITVFFLIYSL